MKNLPVTVRFVILLVAGALAFILLIALIGWLLGWRTDTQFSNGFFIVGTILAVFGAYSALGGFRQRADYGMTFARTVSPASLEERNRQMIKDMMQGTNAAYLLVFTGLLLIGVAILIPYLFG